MRPRIITVSPTQGHSHPPSRSTARSRETLAAASWTGHRGASRAQACHRAGEGDQHVTTLERQLRGVHRRTRGEGTLHKSTEPGQDPATGIELSTSKSKHQCDAICSLALERPKDSAGDIFKMSKGEVKKLAKEKYNDEHSVHNLDVIFSSQSQERNFQVFLEMKGGEIRKQTIHPVSTCFNSEVFPVGGWDYLELIMGK